MPRSFSPTIYAIDFGTSNSLLAAANESAVYPPIALDPTATDPTVLRSVLHYAADRTATVGSKALQRYVESGMEGRLLRSLKRFLPDDGFVSTRIGTRSYRLEELIAVVLRTMRDAANAFFETDVRRVLLGRPALFGNGGDEDALAERRLKSAAQLAGFEHVEFLPEPVAAARDFRDELRETKLVMIADLGGGTSDFCLVRMGPTPFSQEDVLAKGGVSIAGDALDGSLMRHEIARFLGSEVRYRAALGRNVLTMPRALMRLLCSPAETSLLRNKDVRAFLRDVKLSALGDADRLAVERLLIVAEEALGFHLFESIERCKRDLSSTPRAEFRFDYPDVELHQSITRDRFESATQNDVERIITALDATLDQAGVSAHDVDVLCLTGGTARVPRIERALSERFSPERLRALSGFHAVCQGLAEHAQMVMRRG